MSNLIKHVHKQLSTLSNIHILTYILKFSLSLKKKIKKANQPCPNASLLVCPGRPFSFLPNKRPIEDLIPFFLGALWRESWLLLLLLGLLAWPSCEPVELSQKQNKGKKESNKLVYLHTHCRYIVKDNFWFAWKFTKDQWLTSNI